MLDPVEDNVRTDVKDLPLVSIVTPSFNQAEFLEETILSVLGQDYPNIEYIVIDGGSTDGSVDIIRRYADRLAYWVSEPDGGQAHAINKGWQVSSGQLLGWINADDLLLPDAIRTSVAYLMERPDVGLTFGDLELIDAEGRTIGGQRFSEFDLVAMVREAGWISQPGNLVRRSVLEQVGLLDESLQFSMDLDLWLRAAMVCRFGYIRRPLARFRVHDSAKSSSRLDLQAQDVLTIYRKLFERPDLREDLVGCRREAWSSAHLLAARCWYQSGCIGNARRSMVEALAEYPGVALRKRFWLWTAVLAVASLTGGRGSPLLEFGRWARREWIRVKGHQR